METSNFNQFMRELESFISYIMGLNSSSATAAGFSLIYDFINSNPSFTDEERSTASDFVYGAETDPDSWKSQAQVGNAWEDLINKAQEESAGDGESQVGNAWEDLIDKAQSGEGQTGSAWEDLINKAQGGENQTGSAWEGLTNEEEEAQVGNAWEALTNSLFGEDQTGSAEEEETQGGAAQAGSVYGRP